LSNDTFDERNQNGNRKDGNRKDGNNSIQQSTHDKSAKKLDEQDNKKNPNLHLELEQQNSNDNDPNNKVNQQLNSKVGDECNQYTNSMPLKINTNTKH